MSGVDDAGCSGWRGRSAGTSSWARGITATSGWTLMRCSCGRPGWRRTSAGWLTGCASTRSMPCAGRWTGARSWPWPWPPGSRWPSCPGTGLQPRRPGTGLSRAARVPGFSRAARYRDSAALPGYRDSAAPPGRTGCPPRVREVASAGGGWPSPMTRSTPGPPSGPASGGCAAAGRSRSRWPRCSRSARPRRSSETPWGYRCMRPVSCAARPGRPGACPLCASGTPLSEPRTAIT